MEAGPASQGDSMDWIELMLYAAICVVGVVGVLFVAVLGYGIAHWRSDDELR